MAGYRNAADKALEILDQVAVPVGLDDKETLKKAALTSMRSKIIEGARDHLAKISIEAVDLVKEKRRDAFTADVDNIQLVKKQGKSVLDTQLVKGVILSLIHISEPTRPY